MFGMGFTEILLIMVVAIIFIGPEKLPEAVSEIFKFFKNLKSAVDSAKDNLDQELKLNEMKEEAMSYKSQLESATDELNSVNFLEKEPDSKASISKEQSSSEAIAEPKQEPIRETISFSKNSSKES